MLYFNGNLVTTTVIIMFLLLENVRVTAVTKHSIIGPVVISMALQDYQHNKPLQIITAAKDK